jgi:DNA mismatch repair protein MutS2
VTDEASTKLADVRRRRRDNAKQLRQLVDQTALGLLQKGSSDGKMVSLMRGRFCVGLKVSAQCMLGKPLWLHFLELSIIKF